LPKILKTNQADVINQLFSASKEEAAHKPYLLGVKGVSKEFDKQR
jgi:hypothetical protein